MLELTHVIEAARARHRWRGDVRPAFAHVEAEGEESVWDFPRPPIIVPDWRLVQVFADKRLVADTGLALRVLETAHPPTFYIPPDDVEWDWLQDTGAALTCEWRGVGTWYDVVIDGERAERAAWSFQRVYPEFAEIQGWVSFHPARITCLLDGEAVYPQSGGEFGGWVTRGVIGPFKGAPGSEDW